MHIMLTNDDGIQALGIRTLARVLSDAGHKVSVCAPDRERSAASHSITLRRALTAEKGRIPVRGNRVCGRWHACGLCAARALPDTERRSRDFRYQ